MTIFANIRAVGCGRRSGQPLARHHRRTGAIVNPIFRKVFSIFDWPDFSLQPKLNIFFEIPQFTCEIGRYLYLVLACCTAARSSSTEPELFVTSADSTKPSGLTVIIRVTVPCSRCSSAAAGY